MRLEQYLLTESAKASYTTKMQETLHCIGLSILQLKRNLTNEMLLDKSLVKEAMDKFCDVDASYNDVIKFIDEQPSWVSSVTIACNELKNSPYLSNGYVFHRGSSFMSSIYNEFNKLKNKIGLKLANDKWNPSDVWASKLNTIPSFDSLLELNDFIREQLKKKTLVGISLKKVGKSASVTIEDNTEQMKPLHYKGIKKPGKNMFSTGISIESDTPYSVNIRSFRISKDADVTGEVIKKGGSARHGKVNLKPIINEYNIPQIPKNRISSSTDIELKDIVITLWRDAGHVFSNNDIEREFKNRIETGIQSRVGYWQSIIHALEIGAYLHKNKGQADDILNKMFIMASSKSNMSSIFIKVS